LPEDRPTTPDSKNLSYNADELENNEADTCLTHTAQLRKTSDNVYMSNQKSMSLRAYVHAAHRRTEAPALLDSGVTKNFMSLMYAKWLKLPFKCLPYEQPLLNIDGTMNKTGSLKYYMDLQVQTGTKRTNMCFFLTDLGHHRVIVTSTWGRKPASSGLPTDQGKSWELAHCLDLKCRKYHSRSGGSLRGQSISRSAALEWHGKVWGSWRSPSR